MVYTYNGILFSQEILQFATIGMNFRNIMFSKISKPQKDKYGMILLCQISNTVKFKEPKHGMVVARVYRERKWGITNQST